MRVHLDELTCNQCSNRLKDDKLLHTIPNFAHGYTAQVFLLSLLSLLSANLKLFNSGFAIYHSLQPNALASAMVLRDSGLSTKMSNSHSFLPTEHNLAGALA